MKKILDRAGARGYAEHGWLKTSYTFSFADYYNPQRVHFGALRVLNDDWIAPAMGFDLHQHKNMEVVTIPLKGYLRHGDSLEHSDVITPGDIQVMSAGTGIFHSEFNDSRSEALELLQIWVIPKVNNTPPAYRNYNIRETLRKNHLSLIISPDGDAPASILQNAWFSLAQWDKGLRPEYKLHRKDTGVYCFVIEGEVKIDETMLARRDGLGISDTAAFHIEVAKDSYVLFMEVPMI